MKKSPLAAYFVLLILLCAAVIIGAKLLGEQGAYLAQFYMLTPAFAAILTRLFFYKPKFSDANLRFGKWRDYFKFWGASLGITALSYLIYTLLGSVRWDFSGQVFLDRLAQQFSMAGQDINANLPAGFTPMTMLMLFFFGSLTLFNIMPGIITGFGEEFGHRGFMFPLLYRVKPWVGLIIGGLIWYAWHLPLALVMPAASPNPLWQTVLNYIVLAIGSICTFTYLAFVYAKSRSVWVTALAHIVMNNSAGAFSYFVIIQNPLTANIGLTLTMLIVVAILYIRKGFDTFPEYFNSTKQI
jgi:membrane protease YdiL (CAAX protease family)